MPLVTAWVSYFSCLIRYWSFGISPDFQDSYCFRDKTYFQTHLMCFGKSSGCFPSIYWLITNNKYLKVKSEVAQLCLILCDPMDCSLPGSPVHGIFSGNSTGVDCHFLLQGIFLNQGSNPGLPQRKQMLYPLSHQGSH